MRVAFLNVEVNGSHTLVDAKYSLGTTSFEKSKVIEYLYNL